jgi:hypothetical protein
LFAKGGENLKRALKTPFLAINAKGGENLKRALKTPFLAINAKGGESISPKAKGPHHHTNFKIFETNLFSISIFEISTPLRNSISFDIYILRRSF